MMLSRRIKCLAIAASLLLAECSIATVFAHVPFMRGTLSDFLVVPLVYFLLQAIRPFPPLPLAAAVFLFACAVETTQYFRLAAHLHLAPGSILYVLLGSTFSLTDMVVYLLGAVAACGLDGGVFETEDTARKELGAPPQPGECGMPAEIVVTDPLSITLKAHRLLFFQRVGVRASIVLPVVWLFVIWLFGVPDTGPMANAMLAVAIIATILPPLTFFAGRRFLKRAFKSIPAGSYAYRVDEQGVGWRSSIGSSQVNWQGFTRVYPFERLWILIIAERQFIALPAEQLDEATRALIQARISKRK